MGLPEFDHQPGESNSFFIDLSNQPEATGEAGVFLSQIISTVTSQGTTAIVGTELTGSELVLGAASVAGDDLGGKDKTDQVVRFPISGGTDRTQIRITVRVTWSGGAIKDYEALINVKNR